MMKAEAFFRLVDSMLKVIEKLYDRAFSAVKRGIPLSKVKDEGLFREIIMMKYNVTGSEFFRGIEEKIDQYYDNLERVYKEGARNES